MAFYEFVALLFAFNITSAQQSALVYVKSNPIIFGDIVVIRCLVPHEQCRSDTIDYRLWKREENNELLCVNGICPKSEKYSMASVNATFGFELFIHHFSANDINFTYLCQCRFDDFKINLSLEAIEAYKFPSQNTTIDSSMLTDEGLLVNLTLQEVRPIPNCYVYYTDELIAGPIPFNATSTGIFSTAYWNELIPMKHTECSGKMEVICNVLSRKIILVEKYFVYCKGHVSSEIIISVLTITGSFVLVLLIVIFYRVNKQKDSAKTYKISCKETLAENKKTEQQVIKTLLNKSDV